MFSRAPGAASAAFHRQSADGSRRTGATTADSAYLSQTMDGSSHISSVTGERQYLDLLAQALELGERRDDRTGVGTLGLFGRSMRFDLGQGFPLLTTKRLHFKSIVVELLWFLRGETNVRWLHEHGVTIWDEWADADGEPRTGLRQAMAILGRARTGASIDQIARVIESLRTSPHSRRHIVSAWNPADVDDMALPPCHCLFQFHVAGGRLSCQLYQRSADLFLGVPFNIASYALLTLMMAQATGYQPGEFVHVLGDAHLYLNHVDQARAQLAREPSPFPTLRLAPKTDLFAFEPEDITLEGYRAHRSIKAPIAV